MRLFLASQARRSASLRAAAARSAEARMALPKMVSRDLVPMKCRIAPNLLDEKPLDLAARAKQTQHPLSGSSIWSDNVVFRSFA
jgi:hypothetical protein